MKIRILNGGHAAIAYPAGASRHPLRPRGDGGQADRAISSKKLDEGRNHLDRAAAAAVDLEDYRELVARRFANPRIGDTIARLCLDGSNRQPKFILPTVADRLKAGAASRGSLSSPRSGAAIATAKPRAARRSRPTTRTGTACRPPRKAREGRAAEFLAMRDIFGALAQHPAYVEAFSGALSSLVGERRPRQTLADYLSDSA